MTSESISSPLRRPSGPHLPGYPQSQWYGVCPAGYRRFRQPNARWAGAAASNIESGGGAFKEHPRGRFEDSNVSRRDCTSTDERSSLFKRQYQALLVVDISTMGRRRRDRFIFSFATGGVQYRLESVAVVEYQRQVLSKVPFPESHPAELHPKQVCK